MWTQRLAPKPVLAAALGPLAVLATALSPLACPIRSARPRKCLVRGWVHNYSSLGRTQLTNLFILSSRLDINIFRLNVGI